MDFSIFLKIPLSDGYDMGMRVEFVSDTCTQYRDLDPLIFIIFEEREVHIS